MSDTLIAALRESIDEGSNRLHRTWPSLFATGTVGGIDVSIGVMGYLLVKDYTGSDVLAGLAFSIGFIALTMASSELFTENFLVPVVAVAAERATLRDLLRLWGGTAATNLLGGLIVMWIVRVAFPELGDTAIEAGSLFVDRGIGWHGFSSAVLAGIVITLMTWMQSGTDQLGGRLVAAIVAAFLLAFGHLSHVIVASLKVFSGIFAGADYGVGEWFGMFLLWTAGNAVGGIGLVTLLRLVQVGSARFEAVKEAAEKKAERDGEGVEADVRSVEAES